MMMCAFLYVMPVQATQLDEEIVNETVEETEKETMEESVEETVEETTGDYEESAVGINEEPAQSVEESEEADGAIIEEESESAESNPIEAKEIIIPDVVGMTETEAVDILAGILLSDGNPIEIIKEYRYTDEIKKDAVFEQFPMQL